MTKKRSPAIAVMTGLLTLIKKAVSYSPALHCSTIGAGRLNFSVRNQSEWNSVVVSI